MASKSSGYEDVRRNGAICLQALLILDVKVVICQIHAPLVWKKKHPVLAEGCRGTRGNTDVLEQKKILSLLKMQLRFLGCQDLSYSVSSTRLIKNFNVTLHFFLSSKQPRQEPGCNIPKIQSISHAALWPTTTPITVAVRMCSPRFLPLCPCIAKHGFHLESLLRHSIFLSKKYLLPSFSPAECAGNEAVSWTRPDWLGRNKSLQEQRRYFK